MAHKEIDHNHDGLLDEKDERLNDLIIKYDRAESQNAMAWFAIFVLTILTVALFTPFVGDARIEVLSDVLQLVYIAFASIAAAHMGFTSYMTKK